LTSDSPKPPVSEEFLQFLDFLAMNAPADLDRRELVSVLASLLGTYAGHTGEETMAEILGETLNVTLIAGANIEYEEQGGISECVH